MKMFKSRKPKEMQESQEVKMRRVEMTLNLSKHQEKLADLYVLAKGKCYLWTKSKTGKTRILDPDEVVEYRGKI